MIIDYLTVMMVAVVAGAVLTIIYGLMFFEAPSQTRDPGGGHSQSLGCCSG
jgi:hypothetical protein